MEKTSHIRFACWSKPLWEKLLELGFKERGSDPNSKGIHQVKRFYKDNLKIEDSYIGVYLYATIESKELKGVFSKEIPKYHGMSVNKELLEHFAETGIYNT